MGLDVTTVADGVHLAGTGLVNWVVLVEGDRVALIDGGYPRDLGAVEESVRRAGRRPEDVEAVLVTHAHVDHIGTLPELRRRYGVRVLTGEAEARHVRGEVRESATPHDVLLRSYRPRIAAWGLRAAAAGGTRHPVVDSVETVPLGVPLDLPRAPVALAIAGHTRGHTAYVLPGVGAIALGDALVTGHPTSARTGPQLLLDFFHHDPARVRETLRDLAMVPADQLLPGHGEHLQRPLGRAIDEALKDEALED
jgi:glyoxylase-like metal-dependent hydrolase (beta-lactamase superfamily II)